MLAPEDRARLNAVLEHARNRGILGPVPVTSHIRHAEALARCLERTPQKVLDLGSGAGVPGLIHAFVWPEAEFSLLDANQRRARNLRAVVTELALGDRCAVLEERAERAAHRSDHRERYDLVTARAFGSPAVTAECAAGFLVLDGELLVSEPPGSMPERWSPSGLAVLGLEPPVLCVAGDVTAVRIRRTGALPDAVPRRTGVPSKRPLW